MVEVDVTDTASQASPSSFGEAAGGGWGGDHDDTPGGEPSLAQGPRSIPVASAPVVLLYLNRFAFL